MINLLRERNEKLIAKLEKDDSDLERLAKLRIIRQMLKDDDCFLKIPIEMAYSIFEDLGVEKESFKELYIKLTTKQ